PSGCVQHRATVLRRFLVGAKAQDFRRPTVHVRCRKRIADDDDAHEFAHPVSAYRKLATVACGASVMPVEVLHEVVRLSQRDWTALQHGQKGTSPSCPAASASLWTPRARASAMMRAAFDRGPAG